MERGICPIAAVYTVFKKLSYCRETARQLRMSIQPG